ncbi:hypothetical protein PQR52_01570 [Paraburkholderia aspalathi]|uniref:hypothetical protein n=1 Tax=Paraburkholderia aspalathi TaxID=1324617 RepID=UPI0038B9940D
MGDPGMSFESLYPSATGGSNVTLSPLSAPVEAAPAPVIQPVENADAIVPEPSADGGVRDAAQLAAAVAEPAAVEAFVDARPKIEEALRDVRYEEPAAASVTDFNAVTARYPDGVTPDPVERDQALSAFVSAGLGITAAGALWKAGVEAIRSPIQTNEAGALQALGNRADSLVADARATIARVEKTWPGVKDFLNRTGLGNDPATIRFLATKK